MNVHLHYIFNGKKEVNKKEDSRVKWTSLNHNRLIDHYVCNTFLFFYMFYLIKIK